MQVSLDLVGILRDYYPVSVDFSAGPVAMECASGTTLRALLNQVGVPEVDDYFIMLDGERIDLDGARQHALTDGDAITLVAVLKGG